MKKQETKSRTMEGVSGNSTGTTTGATTGTTTGATTGTTSGGRSSYRNRRVTVRLTEGEFELVMRLAKRGNVVHGGGCTMSDVLRGLIFSSLSSLLVLMDGGMAERLVKSVTGNAMRDVWTKARGRSGTEELESCLDIGSEILELFEECEKDGKDREWPGDVRERR